MAPGFQKLLDCDELHAMKTVSLWSKLNYSCVNTTRAFVLGKTQIANELANAPFNYLRTRPDIVLISNIGLRSCLYGTALPSISLQNIKSDIEIEL